MSPVCVLGRFMIVYVCTREVTCDVCMCLLLISCLTSSWSGALTKLLLLAQSLGPGR